MPPPTQRARSALLEALHQARRDARLTGTALAQAIGPGWGQPKVSKIESGRQLPSSEDIRAWARATGADLQQLLDLHHRATHEYQTFRDSFGTDEGAGHQQDAYAVAEQAAKRIIGFQPTIFHGLLQTPAYARALLSLPGGPADYGATPDEIDRMIAARMRRSAILYEPGREVLVIVGEAALHTQVGDREVMREQLQHLVRLLGSIRHATIGILPYTRFPVLIQHGWDLRDNVVTLETTAGDLEIADPVEIDQYTRWGEILHQSSLTGEDAVPICARAIDSLHHGADA